MIKCVTTHLPFSDLSALSLLTSFDFSLTGKELTLMHRGNSKEQGNVMRTKTHNTSNHRNHFSIHSACAGLFSLALSIVTASQVFADTRDDVKYIPSPTAQNHIFQYKNFNQYIEQTKRFVRLNKIYMDDNNSLTEYLSTLPYEQVSNKCDKIDKGIVLVHGLSDTPFTMRDMADQFTQRCFKVRSLLLPGHGTRAGDMLEITRNEWVNTVQFGVNSLKGEVSDVYVGGFSLGGLLAVNAAVNDPQIKGVFAFSPAMAIKKPLLVWNTTWLRYLFDWADSGDQDDYARYEAIPFNAIAETYLLSTDLQDKLSQRPLKTPVFIAQSSDDEVVDSTTNQQYFSETFSNLNSRLISYDRSVRKNISDSRVKSINVVDKKQRIASYSHQSVHVAPTNPHYGKNGSYRNCGVNSTNRTDAELSECLTVATPWRGEIIDYGTQRDFNPNTMARLTYNPQFSSMMQYIDQFLAKIN